MHVLLELQEHITKKGETGVIKSWRRLAGSSSLCGADGPLGPSTRAPLKLDRFRDGSSVTVGSSSVIRTGRVATSPILN